MFVESLCFATYSAWISSQNAIASTYRAPTAVPGSVLDSLLAHSHLVGHVPFLSSFSRWGGCRLRSWLTHPSSHSQEVAELFFEPRLLVGSEFMLKLILC